MRCLSLLLLLLLVPGSALAQAAAPSFLEVVKRHTQINAIGRYDMAYAGDSADPTLDPGKEFAAGLSASYLLGPSLTLEGGSLLALDTKQVRSWVQISHAFFGAQRMPIAPVPPPNY